MENIGIDFVVLLNNKAKSLSTTHTFSLDKLRLKKAKKKASYQKIRGLRKFGGDILSQELP